MKWYTKTVQIVITVMLLAIAALVIMQVFFRFVLGAPLSWPEELGRLIFIWLVFIGSVVVTRNNDHISIELFDQALESRPSLKRFVDAFRHVVFAIVMVVVVVGGLQIIPRSHRLELSATQLPRSLLTLSVVVGGALMALESARQIVLAIIGRTPDEIRAPDFEGEN